MFRARRVVPLLLLAAVAVAVVAVVLATRTSAAPVMLTPAGSALRVSGNKVVYGPGSGQVVHLRGINRSGAEYSCIQGTGASVFNSPTPDQPDSDAMVKEMLSWDINVVRIPLNEGCWLGTNAPPKYAGAVYRKAIEAEVRVLNDHHLFVILALQWNGAGGHYAISPLPMADADHSPAFWRSVATTFKGDGLVMFDLFNEPHGISWNCWLHGCEVPPSKYNNYSYRAAGMQQLVDAVRSTGNRTPLILSGNTWALNVEGYAGHAPKDPDHNLIVAVHTYGGESPCDAACEEVDANVAQTTPVVYTEIGEVDCQDVYLDQTLPFLDQHGIGYLAWAWNAISSGSNAWTCTNGPALITNYGGTPTPYGAGFKAHLLKLGTPLRP